MTFHSNAFRIGTYFFALFLLYGIWVPFLPLWLEGRGLGAEQIGLILAAALWAKIPFGVGLTTLADQSGERRRILVVMAIAIVAGFILFKVTFGFWLLLVGWLVVGALITTNVPIVDSLAILSANRFGMNYGAVRRWGSISFVVASTAGGWYLIGRDSESVLGLMIATAFALLFASFTLPDLRLESRKRKRPAFIDVLKSPTFRTFAIAAALLQASHAALYGFASLHWLEAGISESTIGLLWSVGVVAEITLFSFARRLIDRFGATSLMMMAAVAGIVRWTVLGLTVSLPWLVAGQLLHGFTFGGTHIAAFAFIMQSVPEEQSASAQGIYDSLAMGLLFGIAMAIAGWTYELTGAWAFFLMTGMSLCGGVAVLLLHRRVKSS